MKTSISPESEGGGNVFNGSRSEIIQVEDAEFVRAKGLTVPTALDCSHLDFPYH